jgi:predicted ArsR family transcriptional regulator
MGARGEKPDVRQAILRFIKMRGRAQVKEVAKHLRITHEGARKHLIQMEDKGWVVRVPETDQASAGRPKDFYSVGPEGDKTFPKAYDSLSLAILEGLRGQSGSGASGADVADGANGGGGAGKLLAALAAAQVKAWAPKLEGKTDLEKLEALKGLYLESDPFATVETRGGDFLLIERNCPFLNVAMEHPALCSLTVSTLEMLLGHKVVREERFQAGNGRCVFRIEMESPALAREFRFE